MALNMFGKNITKIGVVGSGQIGPDIALHFSTQGSKRGVQVVVVDVAEKALAAGKAKIEKKVKKGVEVKAFKPEHAEAIIAGTLFTQDLAALAGAGLIIEAATENLDIKRKIFKQLEDICGPDAVLASNSSHMEPEVIFAECKNKSRTAVVHYFFPAERNPLVEIVPGADTSAETASFLMKFYEQIEKVPIHVRKSRYGFAVDPVFEGLFLAAALMVEEGICTVKQADKVACSALGLGVGPFTAMNLTGGTVLSAHGIKGYNKKIMPWFKVPAIIEKQLESNQPWPTAGRDEVVEVPPETEAAVADLFMGAFFGLCAEIIDSGVSTVADLDMAIEIGLVMKAPFRFMNEVGPINALKLSEKYSQKFHGFKVSETLRRQAEAEVPFDIPVLVHEKTGNVAVVTIRRPRVLNALNSEVMTQLKDAFAEIKSDQSVAGAVLKGFGVKAFVSGADINELAALPDSRAAAAFALRGQEILNSIENLGKPVVAAMNGLAFGGGNELAMACHARIAAAGQAVFAGQPEPKLGIIPGYGGTQRLVRWVGFENAWPILRTGDPVSSAKALEIGLVMEEVPGPQVVERAVAIVQETVGGKRSLPPIPAGPVSVPDSPAEVQIGHLSKAVDKLLCEAAVRGAKTTLAEGLRLEAEKFGDCLKTRDMKIGMENFLKNGPKKPAQFVHE